MKYFKKIAMIALVLIAVATVGNSKVQAKGVSLNAKNLTLYGSQKKELKADITLPAYNGGKIVFTSSNKKVAKVNKKVNSFLFVHKDIIFALKTNTKS